jgi:hypothetical protein
LYYAIYSISNHSLFIIKGDPTNYEREILINDLDGGLPVWPQSYMIGKKGEILVSLKGRELKERVLSKKFIQSSAPESQKNLLRKLAQSVSESEDILMIID